jgi:hypothetical protein
MRRSVEYDKRARARDQSGKTKLAREGAAISHSRTSGRRLKVINDPGGGAQGPTARKVG